MWKKYPSIENSYNQKKINMVSEIVPADTEWVVLEKIDGANASIFITEDDISIARRRDVLDDENFGGMQNFVNLHKHNINVLYNHLLEKYSSIYLDTIKAVTLYGEVFGGVYGHPDIKKAHHATKIQGRIHYCPQNEFRVFDIALNIQSGEETHIKYLNYVDVIIDCETAKIPYMFPLFVGKFEDCLQYDVNFQTTIPAIYGLPDIENNFAEGVVIKPVSEYKFRNGSRIIFKKKSEKFNEKKQRQYIKPAIEYEPHIIDLMERVSQYITENRINNIISHFGTVLKKDFGEVLKTFNLDVFEAFEDEEDVILSSYTKEDQKIIRKYVNTECSLLMRAEFFKHTED